MALSDYRLCDVCGAKVFYDATLNYGIQPAFSGQKQVDGVYLDYLGDWKVICADCSEQYQCVILDLATIESRPKTGE